MCFIENNDGLVERSAAHKSERDHLNDVVLHEAVDLIVFHHVAQGIKKGPEVGIDFGLQIAGQEAEFFAGLDGRPGENDSARWRGRIPAAPECEDESSGRACTLQSGGMSGEGVRAWRRGSTFSNPLIRDDRCDGGDSASV